MSVSLQGRIALITGASRGLGLEIALRLAKAGAHLAIAARDAAALELAARDIRKLCGVKQQVRTYALDLANGESVDQLARDVLRDFRHVDVLVNNAAVQGPIGALEQADWNAWKAAFDVNLFAPARLTQLLVPSMRAKGGGKIINLSGGGATSPRPDFSAYAASKCALVRLTETFAEELKPDRIDVNAVAPGAMNTRMAEEVIAAGPLRASREYEATVARVREGGASPARAAELVAWLASPASDGITGKLISAVWDDWEHLDQRREELQKSDLFTLRRVS